MKISAPMMSFLAIGSFNPPHPLHSWLCDGRACVERAAGCQSADRCLADVVGSGQVGLHLTGSNAVEYFPALMRRELLWATEANAARLGALAALTGALADQLALELGQTAKHRHPANARAWSRYRPTYP